ncbi:MAG: hypothetical protein MRZ79_09110 [Bacteroidia bacterium]|nr:hypothetical protein [Bacteroidia bacterium]
MNIQEINRTADGTNRQQRMAYSKAIFPGYFFLDDKEPVDNLYFLYKLAEIVNFYKEDEQIDSSKGWQSFFRSNIRMTLVLITHVKFSKSWQEKGIEALKDKDFDFIARYINSLLKLDLNEDKDAVYQLVKITINMIEEIWTWYNHLQENPLQAVLRKHIKDDLNDAFLILERVLDQIKEDIILNSEIEDPKGSFDLISEVYSYLLRPDSPVKLRGHLTGALGKYEFSWERVFDDYLKRDKKYSAHKKDWKNIYDYYSKEKEFIIILLDFHRVKEQMSFRGSPWDFQRSPWSYKVNEYKVFLEDEIESSEGKDSPNYYHIPYVKRIIHDFLSLVQLFRKYALERLEPEYRTPEHFPQMGLLFSFLELWDQHMKPEINNIPQKHVDFFYKEVLKIPQRKATPDKAFVAFKLVEGLSEFLIPEGSILEAGAEPDGKIRTYQTSEQLIANALKIKHIKSLFVSLPNENPKSGTPIYAAPIANSFDGQGEPFPSPEVAHWHPFGEDQSKYQDNNKEQSNSADQLPNMIKVEPGLVIASPMFLLNEGSRHIELEIWTESESNDKNNEEHHSQKLFDSKESVFPFICAFSGAEEWNMVDEVKGEVSWKAEKGKICITFKLGKDFPPILPAKGEALQNKYSSHFPMLRILLKSEFDYTKINNLRIKKLEIKVDVKEVKQLIVLNDFGVMDATQPFSPFGVIPDDGAKWRIGSKEVFSKPLEEVKLHVKWAGLPTGPGGFPGYYTNYNLPDGITNWRGRIRKKKAKEPDGNYAHSHFELRPSFLKNFDWEKLPMMALWGTKEDIALSDQITYRFGKMDIEANMKYWDPKIDLELVEKQRLSDGMLSLELRTSPQAFGHKQYPIALAEIVRINGLRINQNRNLAIALPKEPYTPIAKSISIDYMASQSIEEKDFNKQKDLEIFHLGPFGHVQVSPSEDDNNKVHIFPPFSHHGNFYLGLTDISPPTSISLLFQFEYDTIKSHGTPPPISWYYLVDDKWKEFNKNAVSLEPHKAFVTTSIIRLELPSKITTDNNLLPPDCFWIRASVLPLGFGDNDKMKDFGRKMKAFGRLREIYPNAIEVKLSSNPNPEKPNIPPKTIKKFSVDIPQVAEIIQAEASKGGEAPESHEDYKLRVAERLRHKSRGVSPWDIEYLVLQKFKQISAVKCLRPFKNNNESPKEMVKVVVIPTPKRGDGNIVLKPRLSSFELLEIEEFLKPISSPAMDIKVRNPIYEELKVKVEVEMYPKDSSARVIQELNESLKGFLSPWIKGNDEDISFTQVVSYSSVKAFIQKTGLVKSILSMVLFLYEDGNRITIREKYTSDSIEQILPIKQDNPGEVLLVSVPVHEIKVTGTADLEKGERKSIKDLASNNPLPPQAELSESGSKSKKKRRLIFFK